MRNKILYFFIIIGYYTSIFSQTIELPIANAGTQLFSNSIFCYGLKSDTKKAALYIYKLDTQLSIKDSLFYYLSIPNTNDYLQMYSDTLHNYLNIYLQKKNTNAVTIFRFNSKFKLQVVIENVDIARLNSISAFEKEVKRVNTEVYTINYTSDSTGKQFYLNKYNLRNILNNFEYEKKWQFPFERKNINTAHFIFANKQHVFLYVNVLGSTKTGQWILKINAETGKLNKATKLNSIDETSFYQFGNYTYDTISQTISLIGQKFSGTQFNQTKNTFNITNATFANAYCIQIDSSGEQSLKQEFKIPITELKTANKKAISSYIFKVKKIEMDKEGSLNFESDIFKSTATALCFSYCNTVVFKLKNKEGQFIFEKNSIQSNPLIENYLVANDDLDLNGKLCVDSLINFESIYYKNIVFATKLNFKTDEFKNPVYLIQKTDSKKGTLDYSLILPIKKIYKLQKVEEFKKSENSEFIGISNTRFIITRQLTADRLSLKLYNW